MSMSKEDGWEDYFCYDCGKLLGHFYVGFGLEWLFRWPLMKIMTLWETCSTCMVLNLMKLKKDVTFVTSSSPQIKSFLGMRIVIDEGLPKGTFMLSTPAPIKDDFIHRIWRESKDVRESRS